MILDVAIPAILANTRTSREVYCLSEGSGAACGVIDLLVPRDYA
jgi:hypothetical protein